MNMTSTVFSGERVFKLWEYQVSHGQLLVRSPKCPATHGVREQVTNIDFVCLGVEYLALPRILRGLEITLPTDEELTQIEIFVGKRVEPNEVRVLQSGGNRFSVVASSFSLSENGWDIFESPFEFRSQFRGNP